MSTQADSTDVAEQAEAPHATVPRRITRARVLELAALLLILAVALVLRAYELDRRSMWLDEFWAMAVSSGHALESGQAVGVIIDPAPPPPTSLENAVPWHQVWFATGETTHPPLFYIMLRLWREAFGESQAVARAMAVVFGVASVALFWALARHLLKPSAALWATLLMAVAVPQIVNAQEIRSYTPQVALALAAALSVVRIERHGISALRALGLTTWLLALVLLHYFSVGFCAALFVYSLLRLRGPARWATLACFLAAAAIFLLLWGPSLWQQRVLFQTGPGTHTDWLWDPTPGRSWRALGDALLIPAQLLWPLDDQTAVLSYLAGALFLVPLLVWRRQPELQLPALWLIVCVGMLVVLDTARSSMHLVHLRYSFIASPPVYLLLVGLVQNIRFLRHILPAVAALSCALPLRTHYTDPYVDWRWPAGGLHDLVSPGEVIVFSSEGGPPYQAQQSYIALAHYFGRFQGPIVIAPQRPPPETVAQLSRPGRRTWLITGKGTTAPEEILPGAEVHMRHNYFGTVDIWHMTWPAEEAPATPSDLAK